jgi:pyruvate kinase
MVEAKPVRTKIVCTVGPASDSPGILEAMIRAGMNVARLNFSHGTHEDHLRKIAAIRRIAEKLKEPVAVLQDLAGPKIRVGKVKDGGVELRRGQRFAFTVLPVLGDEEKVSVSYPSLPDEVKPGDRILLADGTIELEVLKSDGQEIECRVAVGGMLTSHKGINFPGGKIQAETFTEKDRKDLLFGIQNGVDLVGLSFVRDAGDIGRVKKVMEDHSVNLPVIAKIERKEALENIDEILRASDGMMVARGDLGLEIPIENIPNVQKMLIRKANRAGKPVITATQMLRSMVDHNLPSRAEVTDVVNAIYDGTDAVMLSEESAIGKFPVESVVMMAKIARAAEAEFPFDDFLRRNTEKETDLPRAISRVGALLADAVQAAAIVTPTESGSTSRWVSRQRPRQPILALSRHPSILRVLNLSWGVYPLPVPEWKDTDDMFERAKKLPGEMGWAKKGERIVVVAGVPVSVPGTTNLIKVEIVE